MKKIKKIGLLTSGGDSPGMNAAIRSIVKSSKFYGLETYGIKDGYKGLINNDINILTPIDVKQIVQYGGTILRTARCEEFRTIEGRKKAFENIKKNNLDALIVIGGDGSFRGAMCFESEFGLPIIGIPGTIDNDIYGTDNTLGYDTALNTVVEAVDKIRDTATSHQRLFFVEVMGRDAGYIALNSGIASGAIEILIPELKYDLNQFFKNIKLGAEKGKISSIVIVAEGEKEMNINKLVELTAAKFPSYELRVTILGHIQRGGSPSCVDRVLGSRMGLAAVEGLLEKKSNVMVGITSNQIKYTNFEDAIIKRDKLEEHLIKTYKILAI